MNKDKALELMRKGEKLTHQWFSSDEWITEKDGILEFEDGCKCDHKLFWQDRDDASWTYGWSLFDKQLADNSEEG